jgi:hypothetical protein
MVIRNMLIAPDRVQTQPRFTVDIAPLAGFLKLPLRNGFCHETRLLNWLEDIAHPALVDHKTELVVPVFMNATIENVIRFSGDTPATAADPWFLYFKGSQNKHFAMRFDNERQRIEMLRFLGEDLGFLHLKLIAHNV